MEVALIVLPTTALALWGVFIVINSTLTPEKAAFAAALAVALVAIAGVWRLLVPILLGADRAVIAALRVWWFAVWVGGAYVVFGVLAGLIVSRLTELADGSRAIVGSATMVAFFGLPMLLPLVHLALAVPRRQRSGKHFEPKGPASTNPKLVAQRGR